jgi:hypothetical protein
MLRVVAQGGSRKQHQYESPLNRIRRTEVYQNSGQMSMWKVCADARDEQIRAFASEVPSP